VSGRQGTVKEKCRREALKKRPAYHGHATDLIPPSGMSLASVRLRWKTIVVSVVIGAVIPVTLLVVHLISPGAFLGSPHPERWAIPWYAYVAWLLTSVVAFFGLDSVWKPDVYVVGRILSMLYNQGPTGKTRLYQGSRANYERFQKYLEWMITNNLVELARDASGQMTVRITPIGVDTYHKFDDLMESFKGLRELKPKEIHPS
jgi:predicted transcriptional regulator